jgi:aspartate--ammonia ligase
MQAAKRADLAGIQMFLLRKAHLGMVSVSVWPKILKEICERKNIHVFE